MINWIELLKVIITIRDTGGDKIICEGCIIKNDCIKTIYWRNVGKGYAQFCLSRGQCICKEIE